MYKSLLSQPRSASEDSLLVISFSFYVLSAIIFFFFFLDFLYAYYIMFDFLLVQTLFFVCSAMVAIANHTYFSSSVYSIKTVPMSV